MALIIPPGFGQAVYEHSFEGDSEPMVVTFGHDISEWGGDEQSCVNNLFGAWATFVCPVLTNAMALQRVTLYVGSDGPEHDVFDSENAEPAPGTVNAQATIPNTAMLVRKRTDLAGRRGRGRIYLPGIRSDALTEPGLWTSTILGNVNDAFADWLDDLITAPGAEAFPTPPVILHRSEGEGVEPAPTPIAVLVAEERAATQRKRLRP